MSTTDIGRQAESLAADYLKKKGYKILSKNWRTRWCEIDIVATKNKVVYLAEVKYRKTANWGDGVDAITQKKLQQMAFAAEYWVADNDWQGDYELLAISMGGDPPAIEQVIEF